MIHQKQIRVFIIVFILVIVLVLLLNDFAWLGKISFQTNFKKFTPFISILVPQERTEIEKFAYIKQEPVYFEVSLPRDFERINMQFEYMNEDNNLIEIGAQVNENNWDLKPLENKIINNINWPKIQSDGLVLFQRKENFSDINEFFNNLPDIKNIAVYNYDLLYDYKLQDYQPSFEVREMKYQLMGSYQFYTYIRDEDLFCQIKLKTADNLNNSKIVIYDLFNNQIAEFKIDKDIITAKLPELPEGVYKIELQTSNDALTQNILTTQQYFSFINQLNIVQPIDLYTNCKELTFISYLNEGIQSVKINNQNLDIQEIWQQYKISTTEKLSELTIPNGNLQITGNGLFAFTKEQFFNPLPAKVDSASVLNDPEINYVLTYYNLPRVKDSFKINSVNFNINEQMIDKGKLRFVISVPGLENVNKGVILKNLKINLIRQSIWQQDLKQNIIKYLKFYKNENFD